MTPEAAGFLGKARICLADAEAVRVISPRIAGREAYLACFHAAQALIHQRTGNSARTHRGVRAEFLRLTQGAPEPDPAMRSFFAQAYALKATADYDTAPEPRITPAEAEEAIVGAARFLAAIEALLNSPTPDGP